MEKEDLYYSKRARLLAEPNGAGVRKGFHINRIKLLIYIVILSKQEEKR